MKHGSILKGGQSSGVIFDYAPKEFPINISQSASDFVSGQELKKTDFKVADVVAEQVGIAKLQRTALEEKIEEQVLSKLKDVQEKAYQEAYDLGLIEGSIKAFDEYKNDFIKKLEAIDVLLATLEDLKLKLLPEHESHLVRLTYYIAKHIAMKEISENKDSILAIITQLVTELHNEENITVKVSTDDLVFLESLREKTGKASEQFKKVRFERDESVTPGGCIVETNFGSIDATIEERVSRAWNAIASRIPKTTTDQSGSEA